MISCYVLGCNTTSENNPDNVDFYRIAPNLKQKWCKAIGRDPEKCTNEFICAKHFKQSDFFYGHMSKRLILNPGALPSQSLQYIQTKDNKYVPIDLDLEFISMSPTIKKIKTEDDNKAPIPSSTPTKIDIKKPRIIRNTAKISKNLPAQNKIKTKPNLKPQISKQEDNVENINEIDTNNLLVPISPKKRIRSARVPKVDKSYQRKKGVPNLKPQISKDEENVGNINEIDTNNLLVPILPKKRIRAVKVPKVDKSHKRKKEVIQIFNASEVASDLESTDSDCIITDDSFSSDISDPLSLDTNKSKKTSKVEQNQSKKMISNMKSTLKQILPKPNANCLISPQVESNQPTILTCNMKSIMKSILPKPNTSSVSPQIEPVLTISDDSNDEISSGNVVNSNGSSQKVKTIASNVSTSVPVISKSPSILKKSNVSSANKVYQTFKNPLTNEHIQVALDPKQKMTVVDISKAADKNTSLTNLVSQNIQSNEQYILIKPDNIQNITPEKIEKCIAILSDTFYDQKGACHRCKFMNINNFNHDHHYYNNYTAVDNKAHEALQETNKKQRTYIAEANKKIKKLYNEISDLEELIKQDNEILDIL